MRDLKTWGLGLVLLGSVDHPMTKPRLVFLDKHRNIRLHICRNHNGHALSGSLFPLSEPSTTTPQKKTRRVVVDPVLSARCRGPLSSSSVGGGKGTSLRGDVLSAMQGVESSKQQPLVVKRQQSAAVSRWS
jgi:hypothetical protein